MHLLLAAHGYVSHAYRYAPHAYHGHGGGGIINVVLDALVRGAVYRMIAPIFRGLGVGGSILAGIAVIGAVWAFRRFAAR